MKCNVVSQVAVAASVAFICSSVGKSNSSLAFTFAKKSKIRLVCSPWHENLTTEKTEKKEYESKILYEIRQHNIEDY